MSKIKVGDKVMCIKTLGSYLKNKNYNIEIIDNNINGNFQEGFFDTETIRYIYIVTESVLNADSIFAMPRVYLNDNISPHFYDHFIFLKESRKLKLKKLELYE